MNPESLVTIVVTVMFVTLGWPGLKKFFRLWRQNAREMRGGQS